MRWRLRVAAAAGVLVGAGLTLAVPQPAGSPPWPRPTHTPAPAPAGVTAPAPAPTSRPTVPAAPRPHARAGSATAAADGATAAADDATAVPAARTGAPEPRLARRLRRVVERGTRDLDGVVAVAVLDARGRALVATRAERPMLPASAQKLVTAAAAVGAFGEGFRYTTIVRTARPPRPDGTVRGDLVLVGGADPVLAGPAFARVEPQRPRTSLAQLARRLHRRGVRRVAGRVVGDPGVLAHQPVAAGWKPRYLTALNTTRSSGLTVDGGRRLQRRGVLLRGSAAADPALQAARTLRVLLRRQGIRVDGGAAASAGAAGRGVELARVRSPRIDVLLAHAVQESDNHLADGVFRSLGAAAGEPTWRGAARTASSTLAPLGLDWSAARLADGSGLSRRDRLSAALLVRLQQRMWTSASSARWRGLLARAGRRGTLRSRLTGTVAAGRFYGKTGTLRDVRSLVGTVTGPRGQAVHLALVGNRLDPAETDRVRRLADRVVTVTAEELYGCRRVPRPRPSTTRSGRARRLVCSAG